MQEICDRHGVPVTLVTNRDKRMRVVHCRDEIAWALWKQFPVASFGYIGRFLGGYDESSVQAMIGRHMIREGCEESWFPGMVNKARERRQEKARAEQRAA